jgi:hypothetical protein
MVCYLGEAEEFHVIRTPDRDGVANILRIDALNLRTIDSPRVSTLRVVGLGALGLAVIILEHASLHHR